MQLVFSTVRMGGSRAPHSYAEHVAGIRFAFKMHSGRIFVVIDPFCRCELGSSVCTANLRACARARAMPMIFGMPDIQFSGIFIFGQEDSTNNPKQIGNMRKKNNNKRITSFIDVFWKMHRYVDKMHTGTVPFPLFSSVSKLYSQVCLRQFIVMICCLLLFFSLWSNLFGLHEPKSHCWPFVDRPSNEKPSILLMTQQINKFHATNSPSKRTPMVKHRENVLNTF